RADVPRANSGWRHAQCAFLTLRMRWCRTRPRLQAIARRNGGPGTGEGSRFSLLAPPAFPARRGVPWPPNRDDRNVRAALSFPLRAIGDFRSHCSCVQPDRPRSDVQGLVVTVSLALLMARVRLNQALLKKRTVRG